MLIIVFSKVTDQIVYAQKMFLTILLICMFLQVLDILVDLIRMAYGNKRNMSKIILIKLVVSEKIKLHALY